MGLLLILGSITASIFFHFHFWYSLYLVGAFIFFGNLNYKNHSQSVYAFLLRHKWKEFFTLYGFALLIGLIVDVLYGRALSSLWYYPYIEEFWNFFFPVFIYYPLGAFQVYEIFHYVKSILKKYLSPKKLYEMPNWLKQGIISCLIFFMIAGIVLPIVNYFHRFADPNRLMILIMIATTFSTDAVMFIRNKTSLLLDFLQGNSLIVASMLVGWFIAATLTEIPNLYSHEWIYTNISMEMVFTFGWFFLVFMPIRCIDLIKDVFRLH